MRHVNLKVSGLVQGVFFRASAKEVADNLNLKGLARNEADGSVYIEIEGDENSLEEFIDWCKVGPKFAKIEDIKIKEGRIKNFKEFLIY